MLSFLLTAVKKAFDLLKVFTNERQELTLTELSTISRIDKSTVLRLLYTLRNEEIIEYNEETRKYSLGIEILRLGQIKYNMLNIQKVTKKYMQPYCDEHNLIGNVSVRKGDKLIMLERYCSNQLQSWSMFPLSGNSRELYSTGTGRLFLSKDSDLEIERYFERTTLHKITDDTITDKGRILERIQDARIHDYSYNDAENALFTYSISVPVYNKDGKMEAGICLSGPAEVVRGPKRQSFIEDLRSMALKISHDCGYL